MNFLRCVCLALAFSLSLPSPRTEAAVYTTGVSFQGSQSSYQLGGWSLPNATGNGALIRVFLSNTQLSAVSVSLGIGSLWYQVSEGALIDPGLVATAAPFIGVYGQLFQGQPIQATLGEPFYLGFWLNSWEAEPNTFFDDRFGWAKLRVEGSFATGTRLELLSSAIEDSGRGITAGSFVAVPEPGSFLSLGAAFLLMRRRR